eukprot:SAG11_NODE_966_length_6356_cov_29.635608_2_plen_46_part_00
MSVGGLNENRSSRALESASLASQSVRRLECEAASAASKIQVLFST